MHKLTPFEWVVDKLTNHEKVKDCRIISDTLLSIVRVNDSKLSITKTNLEVFDIDSVKSILQLQDADFILHTIKEPLVVESAFDYLEQKRKILGGFSDLMRVVNQGYNWPYLHPEIKFIVRGLKQHTRVKTVRRLDNKRYEIERHGLEIVTVIALNDYDLGVEAIRNALNDFQKFDAVLKSNPNGKITSAAIELADTMQIPLLGWGELLRMLNKRWN